MYSGDELEVQLAHQSVHGTDILDNEALLDRMCVSWPSAYTDDEGLLLAAVSKPSTSSERVKLLQFGAKQFSGPASTSRLLRL